MDFLYSELSSEQRAEVEQHLRACPICRQKQAAYLGTLKQLGSWNIDLPEKPKLAPEWSPAVKWAAAAALLVTTAFATGRFATPSLDSEKIQAQISGPLEEKITRDINLKIQQEAQLAAERALEMARRKLQTDLAVRLEEITEKAFANAASDSEQLVQAMATLRDQNKTLYATLQELETKHRNQYQNLRQDLEKVAVYTDESLRMTQRQFVQLASFKQEDEQQ